MLPDKETLTIEFKSDINKLSNSDIFDAVVAFANTEGVTYILELKTPDR